MKRLITCVLLAASPVLADSLPFTFAPEGAKGRRVSWQSNREPIPHARPALEVSFAYVCHGPVEINASLQFFAQDGLLVADKFMRPSLKIPAKSEWGKPHFHAFTLQSTSYPANATSVRLSLSGTARPTAAPEPPRLDLNAVDFKWGFTPRGVRTANWFTTGEDVVFRGVLPPGKTGLRILVRDSSGQIVHQSEAPSAEWRWRPSRPGFYTAAFSWLDAAGNATPAVESFYCCDHLSTTNAVFRNRFATFARGEQAFAVCATPERDVTAASPVFGFNLDPLPGSEYAGGTPFELIRLLGMHAFIRYHRFHWEQIEGAGRGKYNWKQVDDALAAAAKAGYGFDRIIMNTFGTPAWNSTAPESLRKIPWLRDSQFYAPRDMSAWHDYIAAFCRRYPGIRYLELWNEPHLPGYSLFWQKSSPAQFVELLKSGYTAAKEVDPSITVLMGGIGMRYLPFYDQFVQLGGVEWFDMLATHCGYDMRPFRTVERKYGAPSKPYWEDEWHTVLYNCSADPTPSEETCTYRMLTNLADMLHEGGTRITGFGLGCGVHTPETARFYAKAEGVQQVSGLFRTRPFLEPRLAALALRTATDRFSGDISRLGAWAFGDDGQQRLAAFTSASGPMAFLWCANPKTTTWHPALLATMQDKKLLDWEGRTITPADLRPERVYFIVDPDLAPAHAHGVELDKLDYSAYNFKPQKTLAAGSYAPLAKPILLHGTNVVFAADLQETHFALDVRTPGAPDSILFAIDVEGKGQLEDVVELRVSSDGTIVKPRTPALKGDIPPEFSPANVPLSKSRATVTRAADGTRWQIKVAMSDLYPFVHSPGRQVRFALATPDGGWGEGLGRIRAPRDFGTLCPSGHGKTLAVQQDITRPFGDASLTPGSPARVVATSNLKGAGAFVRVRPVPGSRLRYAMRMRGNASPEIAVWHRSIAGKSLGRVNVTRVSLTDEWQDVTGECLVSPDAASLDFVIFSWRNGDARFEIADFTIVNE